MLTFYDIASSAPLRTFAPNPWKTRLALNLKRVSYSTHWLHLPEVTPLRIKLGAPANRTLPDGSPYHTLPLIHDHATQTLIGDSFEIALYLDKVYQQSPTLIPKGTTGLTAAFNAQVDGIFTKYVALADQMPFDPAVAEETEQMFAKRFNVQSLDDMKMTEEARSAMFIAFEAALGELAKAYRHTGGTTDYIWLQKGTAAESAQRGKEETEVGPWLDGDQPAYPDIIVGAWLKMMEASMRPEDWKRVRGWQNGLWERIVDALADFAVIV